MKIILGDIDILRRYSATTDKQREKSLRDILKKMWCTLTFSSILAILIFLIVVFLRCGTFVSNVHMSKIEQINKAN